MDSTFNPYLKWLGIPLKDQPPNHYRLLGVEPLESDADIIERAADRQMTYIRSLQNGEHAAAAQDLLNEFSSAKVCLLNPQRKAKYDHQLRRDSQEVALTGSALPIAEPLAAEPLDAEPLVAEPLTAEPLTAEPPPKPSAKPPAKPAAKPAPRRNRQASDSNIGSAGNSGVLKQAAPLSAAPAVAAAAPPAVAAKSAKPASMQPAPLAGKDAEKPRGSILPWIIAATVPIAVFAVGFLIFMMLDRPDGSPEVGEFAGVNANDNANQNATDGNTSLNNGSNDNSNTSDDGGNDNSNTNGQGNGGTDVNTNMGGNTSGPSVTPTADVLLEAPFLLGTLESGNPVLSDRDYTFAEVDSELEGLQFTRWQFGPVQAFDLELTEPGRLYLILPPVQYSRPLPNVVLGGWTKSDLTCHVRTAGGIVRRCQVYYRDGRKGSLSVATSPAVWPMLAANNVNRKGRILGEIVNNPDEPPPDDPQDPGPDPADPRDPTDPQPPPKPVAKLAVPTSAAQKPIQTRIASVFELDTLKTGEEKITAAKRMYEVGREPSDNHIERYVMLATAARMAADAGDLDTALNSVNEIDKSFEAKTAAMQLYLVRQFADARIPKALKEQQLNLVVPVLDRGLANDEFDAVDKTVTELFSSGLSHKTLGERRRIAREMKSKYRVVAAAKEQLKANPDDGAANKVVGEYICFQKVDWDSGLPMLAKSDEAELRDLAQSDLDSPEAAAEQLKVGEGWYKIAQAQDSELAQGAVLTRAEDWFRKALSGVEGLDEAHAKKRLDEIKEQLVDLGWVDIPKKATIAAASGYSCDIYHNGERILSASHGVGAGEVTLKRGDLLMVRARKSTSSYSGGYSRGFACVIKYEGSDRPVATGHSDQWKAFVPSSTTYWYKPENVARTVPYLVSPSAGHTELATQTGVAARSLWYASSNTSDAYFYFQVK